MTTTNLPYKGPEHRRVLRRIGGERREMLRWEPSKDDRRGGKDRRQSAPDLWGRSFGR